MKKILLIFFFSIVILSNYIFIFTLPLFAQQVDTAWVRRYNGPGNAGDLARALATDDSGYIYVTGESWDATTARDYATVKYKPNGDTIWVRRYNGPVNGDDYATAIAVDDSFYIYVTGYSPGSGTSDDFLTIKYKPNGDTAWVRRYDGPGNYTDRAYAIAVDDYYNVFVTGYSTSSGTSADYATIKYDPDGDTGWVRIYNAGNGLDEALAITVDGSGNIYVTGQGGSGPGSDYATIKYYLNGDTAWVRTYNGPGNSYDEAHVIAVDGSNNVYVTGASFGSGTYYDYATIKYYLNGDTAWVRRYNGLGNGSDYANAITVDGYGNVYVTGQSYGGTDYDYSTIKYYPNGDTAWVRRYNGQGNGWDEAHAIAVDGSNNVYVTGQSIGSGTDYDYVTIKYESNGDTAWVRRYNGPGDSLDAANAIAVGCSGNIYVTGWSVGSGTDYDYATIKYVDFLRGDANGDAKRTVSDVVYIINYLFKGGTSPNPKEVGHVNCDCHITVSDVVYLINYLFKGGPPPC